MSRWRMLRYASAGGRAVAIACLVVLVTVRSVAAATFVVDSQDDLVDVTPFGATCETAAATCTLRAAIQQANSVAGVDTIEIPDGYYQLTIAGTGEDLAATGDLDITQSVIIRAVGTPFGVTIDAQGLDRVFHVTTAAAVVTMEGLGIINGNATGDFGGGILNSGTLTMQDGYVYANTADSGSGLDNNPGATATLRRMSVTENVANTAGAGVVNAGTIDIVDSVIARNTAGPFGGGGFATAGSTATATLTNTTISGNTAGGSGAGILLANGAVSTTLRNVTVTDNHAGSGGGGIAALFGGSLTLSNTILAGNTGSASSPNCSITITSGGFNLFGSTSGCTITGDLTGNVIVGSANLSPLGGNGGSTETHVPLPGSAAIDAGNNLLVVGSGGNACAATDQRLGPRPIDGNGDTNARCDIGAVEVGCGNRFVESGELCDDPCCDSACTSYLPPGSSCEDGDLCTTDETCDAFAVCGSSVPVICGTCEVCDSAQGCVGEPPAESCRTPTSPKKSFFSLKPGKTPDKNAAIWKWARGQATSADDFGFPVFGTTEYRLCVYDGANDLLMGARVPSGTETLLCGNQPCWKILANGTIKYGNKAGTPEGVASLSLAPGPDAKAKIGLKAKGLNLTFPTLPVTGSVRVQLKRLDSPLCWDARFSTNVLKNRIDGYTAQSD